MSELDNVLRAYQKASRDGRVAALASVVAVRGSTYRRIGAHMLITEDGEATGAISGGCLERDIRRHAMWSMQCGTPRHLVYDSTADDDDDAEGSFALGCNGVVEVLVERLLPGDAYMAFVAGCLEEARHGVVATVFSSKADTIAIGSRVLCRAGNHRDLTLGLNEPEPARAIAQSAELVLALGVSSSRILQMRGGGSIAVCFEVVQPAPRLVIFGGGADAVPLVRLAKALGIRVFVADPRPGQATPIRFSGADGLITADPAAAIRALAVDRHWMAVVMNHDYRLDSEALKALLATPIGYLGVLGPKHRTGRLLTDLTAKGVVLTEAQLARVYGPVGLDLGAETPEEVALAIVAEMKAVIAGRGGGSLRERPGSIHGHTQSTPEAERSRTERASCSM